MASRNLVPFPSCLSDASPRSSLEVCPKLVSVSIPAGLCRSILTNIVMADRIAGGVSEVNGLKEAFNRGETPVDGSTDIYAVCDLVKSWFRVLPEPVFPSDSYFAVIDAGRKLYRAWCLRLLF